ncbi:hypothetical protein ACOME3_008928 [Neoechinorhynchus agilis]
MLISEIVAVLHLRAFKNFKRPKEVSAIQKFLAKRTSAKKHTPSRTYGPYFSEKGDSSLVVDQVTRSDGWTITRKRSEFVRNVIEDFLIERISTGELSNKCPLIDKVTLNSVWISKTGKHLVVNLSLKNPGDLKELQDNKNSIENTIRYLLISEKTMENIPPVRINFDLTERILQEFYKSDLEFRDNIKGESTRNSIDVNYDNIRTEIIEAVKVTEGKSGGKPM